MRRISALTSIAIVGALFIGSTTYAFASPSLGDVHDLNDQTLATIVAQSTPNSLVVNNTETVATIDGFVSHGDVDVEIPKDGHKPVMVHSVDSPSISSSIKLSLDPRIASKGVLAQDRSVVFEAENLAQTVHATKHGIRINTVITSRNSPQDIHHKLELSSGLRLVTGAELERLAPPEGRTEPLKGVYILNSDNDLVGGISAPWAVDARGVAVPTRYTIEGNVVVQHVEHRGSGVTYPVVADPWLGLDLISKATWEHRSKGWTLKVSPTGWARANAPGYLVGVAGWEELYSKYKNKGLNTNLGGMRDQYICHQQFVFWKATWNLDEWRPDVSYAQTVNSKCNPGGGKIID